MQPMGATVAVLGASGYAGGELLRLLAGHPVMSVVAAAGATRAGEAVGDVHPHLRGAFDLPLVPLEQAFAGADVCFSCLPHGVLPEHVSQLKADLVIDLAEDFRGSDDWVYGLPELTAAPLQGATRIANPGCYPTATLLALVPFLRAGVIEGPLIVDAMSGVSGAGRTPRDGLLFSNLAGDVTAYGTIPHRHVAEMERSFGVLAGSKQTVSFTPHLVPTSRGLLVTARAALAKDLSDDDALEILHATYGTSRFVQVVQDWPSTKTVAGTNKAHVSARVDAGAGFLVCSAAIDNLGKGAAGQAVQNANLALGLDEAAGLEQLAVWP